MKSRNIASIAALLFLAAMLAAPVASDTVTLWDGEVLEGKVTDEGDLWHIETEKMIYAVAKTAVRKIVRDEDKKKEEANPVPTVKAKPRGSAPRAIAFTGKKSNTTPPDKLLVEAEKAIGRKTFGYARECLDMILKFHPNSTEARRALTLRREIPDPDGRLLLGFDTASETRAAHATWINDPKVVPHGSGCVRLKLQGGPHAKFRIPTQSFSTLKYVNFWVWNEAPIVGYTGTTYIVLYTSDPKDFMQASFQLKGDGVWRKMRVDAGRFKRRTNKTNRRFTHIGFWNPSPEMRHFIVDEIRVVEETPPITNQFRR
jgi:hypothetical protein